MLDHPAQKVDRSPSLLEVEHIWKEIYESAKPLQIDTSSNNNFKTFYRNMRIQQHQSTQATTEGVKQALGSAPALTELAISGGKNSPLTISFWQESSILGLMAAHHHQNGLSKVEQY